MTKRYLLFILILSTFSVNHKLLAADDYISSLEQESNTTQVDSATQYSDVIKTKKQKALTRFSTIQLPVNLNKTGFKVFLMNNAFDSYMTFLELDKKTKDIVYEQYQRTQTPDINIIESLISQLMQQQ